MKKITLLFIVFLPVIVTAQSGLNKVGTVGAQFLKIDVGAYAMGMGGAFTAVTKDATAAYWNPAALTMIKNLDINFSYTRWIADINHQAITIAKNFDQFGAIGFSLIRLGTEQMEITTTTQQEGTGELFSYQDLALGFSYAKQLTDKFSVGGTLKFIDQQIYILHARGFAFDVATYYWTGFKTVRMVMALRNFGSDIKFGGSYTDTVVKGQFRKSRTFDYGEYPLPLTFNLGLAGEIINSEAMVLTTAIEAIYLNDYTERLNLGMDLKFLNIFSLRLGYKINYEQEDFSTGLGFNYKNIRFDYAYANMDVFDGINTFSLGYSF